MAATTKTFQHNFHDAHLVSFALGPRREVDLEIALDPVWNEGRGTVHVRFGAMENSEEVTRFLKAIPPRPSPEAYLDEIATLRYGDEKPFPVFLELGNSGKIVIRSQKVTET